MRYVYLLESEAFAGQRYVGIASSCFALRVAGFAPPKIAKQDALRSLGVGRLPDALCLSA